MNLHAYVTDRTEEPEEPTDDDLETRIEHLASADDAREEGAIVPLDQVRFARRMQIGSSSPKLVALTPGGTKVLKRGNPFDGGIGNVDEVLTAVVRGG